MEKGCNVLAVFMAVAISILLTGCLAPTKSTTTIYRTDGTVEKVIESSESVVKTITDSTKNKTCATWDNGWLGGICYVPPGSDAENPMGALKVLAGKNDRGIVTFSDKHDAKYIADVIAAARSGEISLGAAGISNSTGSGESSESSGDVLSVNGTKHSVTPETIHSTITTENGNTIVVNPESTGNESIQ